MSVEVQRNIASVATRLRPKGNGSRRRTRAGRIRVPWWFVVPAVAVYAFIVLVPSVQGTAFAFTDWNGLSGSANFVGWENFQRVFSDDRAMAALSNTLLLALIVTVLQNVIGLALALGLNAIIRTRHVLRVIFFIPVVLTPLVAGYVWGYLLSPRGTLNEFLTAVGLGAFRQDWLGQPQTALLSVCVAIVWQFSGYAMVIYLAGLQGIPAEVREAAMLDGAGPFRRLFSVTLPLINGAIVVSVLLTVIGSLNQFDQVMAMTNGGPGNATQTLSTTIYRIGFALGDYPYGTALSVVMTIIVAVVAIIQYRVTARRAVL